MIFERSNVTKSDQSYVYNIHLTPTDLNEHDEPVYILEDYVNTAGENKSRRERTHTQHIYFASVVEVDSHGHVIRNDNFTMSVG